MTGTVMVLHDKSMPLSDAMSNDAWSHWSIGDETPTHLVDAETRQEVGSARQSDLMETSVMFSFQDELPIGYIDTHGRFHGRDDDDDIWKSLLIASALAMTSPDGEVLFASVND